MEDIEEPEPETPDEILNYKNYELNLKEDIYSFEIELFSNNLISFKLSKSNTLSLYYYIKKYKINDIFTILSLNKNKYADLSEIILCFDEIIKNKNLNLVYDNVNKIMILKIKRVIDSKEIESNLKLNEIKFTNEEMFKVLIDKENSKDTLINNLVKKNKENEEHINYLEDKIKILENEIKNYKSFIDDKLNIFNIGNNNMNLMNNKENMNQNNNGMNNLIMFNNIQKNEIINNLEINNINQKNNDTLYILFSQDWSGQIIGINCSPNDKISEVIKKYREKSNDNNKDREFIYNANYIESTKTVSDLGLSNFSKIQVAKILSHEIKNGIWVRFKLDKKEFPPVLLDSNKKFEKAISALYNLKYTEIDPKQKYNYFLNNKMIDLSKTLNELGINSNSVINIR